MERAVVASVFAAMGLVLGCGQGADDIARGIDDAVRAAKPKPGPGILPPTRPPGTRPAGTAPVPEEETESAARRAVCSALAGYSADPSQSLSDYIGDYAERQRVLADLNLNEVDPDEADRLAAAASDINDSQEAASVASELGCG